MALREGAIIEVDECLKILGISADDPALDTAQIEKYIDGATAVIQSYCNRKFVEPTNAITELFCGDGSSRVYVKQGRICETSTPILSWSDGSTWTVTTGTFGVVNDEGYVYFTDGSTFFKGLPNNWKIVYKYGWTKATLPSDVKLLASTLVQRQIFFQSQRKEGLSSEGFSDSTTSYNTELSRTQKDTLDHYRLVCL